MGRTKVIKLDEKQKAELEKGYRESDSHAFRQRCHLILLKSKGQTSKEVAQVLNCCEMAVNNWVTRLIIPRKNPLYTAKTDTCTNLSTTKILPRR